MAQKSESEEHPSFTRAKALPEPWRSHFPKSQDEARAWKAYHRYRALATEILAVAQTRIECAWSAYIAVAPGWDHDREWEDVLVRGTKLDADVARALFPELASVPYHY